MTDTNLKAFLTMESFQAVYGGTYLEDPFHEFNIPISAAVHSDIFLRVYIYFSFFRKKLKSQKSITNFFTKI